jgi:hypothetical protein
MDEEALYVRFSIITGTGEPCTTNKQLLPTPFQDMPPPASLPAAQPAVQYAAPYSGNTRTGRLQAY